MVKIFISPAKAAWNYIVDVYKPDKASKGTTVFGDTTDGRNPEIVEVDMNGVEGVEVLIEGIQTKMVIWLWLT